MWLLHGVPGGPLHAAWPRPSGAASAASLLPQQTVELLLVAEPAFAAAALSATAAHVTGGVAPAAVLASGALAA